MVYDPCEYKEMANYKIHTSIIKRNRKWDQECIKTYFLWYIALCERRHSSRGGLCELSMLWLVLRVLLGLQLGILGDGVAAAAWFMRCFFWFLLRLALVSGLCVLGCFLFTFELVDVMSNWFVVFVRWKDIRRWHLLCSCVILHVKGYSSFLLALVGTICWNQRWRWWCCYSCWKVVFLLVSFQEQFTACQIAFGFICIFPIESNIKRSTGECVVFECLIL